MIFERIKSEGIAQNSYLIGSRDEAAVIDPRRDGQVYLDSARAHSLRIKHIFETHRNEDYAIGSLELSHACGADIWHGPGLPWGYGNTLKDGQEFRLGDLRLQAIHTPGHTDESVSYAVIDLATGDAVVMVFSGDDLFVSDTGRTDLYGLGAAERLAGDLYDSLFQRLLPLGDGVILCPAHGGGSVCGRSIAAREESTLGIERQQNPWLQFQNKAEFIRRKVEERHYISPYFRRMEKYNLEGPPRLGHLPEPPALRPDEFCEEMAKGTIVLDASEPAAFGGAHIKGAYSIWRDGIPRFAGWVLPYDRPILLVLPEDRDRDIAVRYLIRLGYDRITGYLRDGTAGWYNAGLPIESLPLISVHELKARLEQGGDLAVLDVRSDDEWEAGHIKWARHIYVGHLLERLAEVPRDRPLAVMCNVGRRSSLAASLLLRAGFTRVHNVLGSTSAWKAAGFPLTKD